MKLTIEYIKQTLCDIALKPLSEEERDVVLANPFFEEYLEAQAIDIHNQKVDEIRRVAREIVEKNV